VNRSWIISIQYKARAKRHLRCRSSSQGKVLPRPVIARHFDNLNSGPLRLTTTRTTVALRLAPAVIIIVADVTSKRCQDAAAAAGK